MVPSVDAVSNDTRLTGREIAELAARSKLGPALRTHLSATPLAQVRPVEQDARLSAMGLWFDLHCEWMIKATVTREFAAISGRYVYQVELGESRILQIGTAAAFDEFEDRYATRRADSILCRNRADWRMGRGVRVRGHHVDWRAVERDYDGVEIAPYRVDRPAFTAAHAWYADWDVASGCVWRPREVRLELLGRVPGEISMWAAPRP